MPDAASRYWNPAIESMLGSEAMRSLQLERLQARVRDLFAHAPYFRRRLEESGVAPGPTRNKIRIRTA